MTLETQVTSFLLSKQLKEIGVDQDALYYWDASGNLFPRDETYTTAERFHQWYTAAFTVAELGILLPEWSSSHRDVDDQWQAFPSALFNDIAPVLDQPTEAEARGKLLVSIYKRYPSYPLLDYTSALD